MKTNEIDVAVEPFKQSANFFCMCGRVVDATKNDVLKRKSALMREVVVAQ